ncbi:MAG: endolytic transglycosylase MltG [Campylobacterales bacterium]|nr:endolytic transglycosylase MltG [Campylobacterales bacterium]
MLFYITIPLKSQKVIFIPKGSTNNSIKYLNNRAYDLNIIDKIIILTLGHPQNGWIDLKSNYMTKADFLHKLTTSKAALKTVTLIPGETSYVFLRLLAKKMNVSIKELEKVYKKVAFKNDGNILADTYKLPLGMNEEALIYYLFSQTNKKYKSFSNKIFGTWNQKKWYKYLTIASIVQKESANIKEMPIVSSVIYNRLKRSMALQMDGTLNYGKYSHVKITAKRIREDKSLYNTYKNKGIPAHPIAAVSLDAIKAAIFPSKTSYLYFVKNEKTGLHRFASTYSKHIKNINIYRYEKNLKKLQNKKKKLIIKKKEIQRIQRKDFQVFPKKSEEKTKKSVKNLWNNVK